MRNALVLILLTASLAYGQKTWDKVAGPSGSAGGAGSYADPIDLATGISLLNAGTIDTLVLKSGTYSGGTELTKGGSVSAYYRISNYPGESPSVVGVDDYAMRITGIASTPVKYVTIDSISFDSDISVLRTNSTRYIQFIGCSFGPTPVYGIWADGLSSYWVVRGCTFTGAMDGSGSNDGFYVGGGDSATYNLFENNTFTLWGHAGINFVGGIGSCSYNVVRNNTLTIGHASLGSGNRYWQGVLTKPYASLMEGNTISKCGLVGDSQVFWLIPGSIVRFNKIIADTSYSSTEEYGFVASYSSYVESPYLNDSWSWIYNNTFHHVRLDSSDGASMENVVNSEPGSASQAADTVDHQNFVNNIFFQASTDTTVFRFNCARKPYQYYNTMRGNLFYHGASSSRPVFRFVSSSGPMDSSFTLAQAQSLWPTRFSGNFYSLPGWSDYSLRTFVTDATSPVVNSGTYLTTATSTSNSTTAKVGDARFFTDGWGIITGDSIVIGSTAAVGISSISNDTLTLTSSRSWSAGDGVWLHKNGLKVDDIGVYQGSFEAPPSAPSAPTVSGPTGLNRTGFTANWSSVDSVAGYRLDVSTAADFSSYVSGYEDRAVISTSEALTGLSRGTLYYYRVRAVNGVGTSDNSSTQPAVTFRSIRGRR